MEFVEHVDHPRIKTIQMGIVSPEQILRRSVCEVFESSLYVRQLPKPNGVNDLRMGTSDWNMKCSTCANDVINCPGHIGHIVLAKPMYNPGVFHTMIKVLRCVCFFCSALLVPRDDPRLQTERFLHSTGKKRLLRMVTLSTNKHECHVCGGAQPKYSKVGTTIKHKFDVKHLELCETEEEKEWALEPITPTKLLSMFKYISDEDCITLGGDPIEARPNWMILTIMVVPPPIIRPSIRFSDNSRSRGQDDLTTVIQEIVKTNNTLKNALAENKPKVAKKAEDELQELMITYFHHDTGKGAVGGAANSASGPPHSNRALRTVPTRIKGKKGRMRGNLSGKRVDFCGRSVVSPDPTGDIDELGVPLAMATKLTMPERVTDFNITDLTNRVLRGPGALNGATNVVEPDGTVRDLRLIEDRSAIMLEVGCIVHRHLKNGDVVMFNRQPSLHKMSIMAHRIRIIPTLSFRLPICTTVCYNADFDGDEMNIHVSQTIEAQTEQRLLMSTTQQIISAQANKPIISLVQDSLISAYLMTLRQEFFTRGELMQLVMCLRYPLFEDLPIPAILKPEELWTGKQVFSLLLPNINLDKVVRDGGVRDVGASKAGYMDVEECRVLIREGELLTGSLCKKTLGNTAGGVVHVLVNDVGHQEAANFIGDAQRLLVMFMESKGFTVGIADCVSTPQTQDDVQSLLSRCTDRCEQISQRAQYAPEAVVEGVVTSLLQGMLSKGSSTVQKHMDWRNNINLLVTCGAKGSPVNISQIIAYVGQQTVKGGRIHGRSLPSFDPRNPTPESKGFVKHSYSQGLTPEEYFFHSMGGREGLVDTAVKTAETGYIQRRLMKNLEDMHVANDNTVRDARGHMYCTYYGGDGTDAIKIEKQSLHTFEFDDEKVVRVFTLGGCGWAPGEVEASNQLEIPQIIDDRDRFREMKMSITAEIDGSVFVPVHVPRILKMAQHKYKGGDVMPYAEFVERREALFTELVDFRSPEACFFLLIYLRANLGAKTMWDKVRMRPRAVEWVFSEVRRRVLRGGVDPGEMVGTLAASSIGEPCTQMTLNTFHFSGVANKNMTLGVPRLKEIINATDKLKTPSLSVRLEAGYRDSEGLARSVANSITHLMLGAVVHSSEIIHDPDSTKVVDDCEFLEVYRELGVNPNGSTPWVMRLVLDRQLTKTHELTVVDVASMVAEYLGASAQVLRSEVNTVDWVIRIRLHNFEIEGVEPGDKFEELAMKTIHDYLLDNTPVNGIPSISRSFARTERTSRVGENGELVHKGEWIVDTEGSNLGRVLTLEGVDPYRTISNDIQEVVAVLGIGAGMAVMMDELRRVLSFDGGYVDDHHIQMLAKFMTQSGRIVAVSRHGLKELGGSTLQRASYEECSEVLNTAAIFGARDDVCGITESVIMGQQMPTGTGICGVLTREDALPSDRTVAAVKPLAPVVAPTTGVVRPMVLAPRKLVSDAVLPPGFDDESTDDESESGEKEGGGVVEESPEAPPPKRFRPSSPEFVGGGADWRPSSPMYD